MEKLLVIFMILVAFLLFRTFIVVFMPFQWFLGIVFVTGIVLWYLLFKRRR